MKKPLPKSKLDKLLLYALIITALFRFLISLISIFHASTLIQFFEIWTKWDTSWYISIAKQGYVTSGKDALAIVFYPGYPIFIAIVDSVFKHPQFSSIFVSLFFTFTAAIYLYKLTLLDYDKLTAFRSVWFLNIFPTSYFLQAGYTESLFLTSSIAAFYYYRLQNLPFSSVAGFFSTLTRVNGILLLPSLLFETKSKKHLLPLLFFPLGTIIYLSINYYLYKDPFYFTVLLESNWYKHFSPPWEGFLTLYRSLPTTFDSNFYTYSSEFFTIISLLILTPLTYIYTRKSYAIYLLLNLLLITSTSFILSTPRYALTLFPLFILAARVKNIYFFSLISLLSFLGLLYFSNKFIIGSWAF